MIRFTKIQIGCWKLMAAMICLLIMFSCTSGTPKVAPAQKVETAETTEDEQVIKEFITNMYNNGQYTDYEFLEKHCSRELLDRLADDYDYDTEGVAYAVWDFRTSAQDGKPDAEVKSEVLQVEYTGDGWYTYEFYDGGWRGKTRLKCHVQEGEVIMDALEKLYDEWAEMYD